MEIQIFFLALLNLYTRNGFCLSVNVDSSDSPTTDTSKRESNGGFYKQTITGNSSTDTVLIEFSLPDGTFVSQLTDYRMESQIVRVFLPGEEELNQPRFQALCFVSGFPGDLIPPEAVMKLRQKHPDTIRIAEEDRGDVVQDSSLLLHSSSIRLASISSHLSSFCRDAKENIFSSQHELFEILDRSKGPDVESISKVSINGQEQRCYSSKEKFNPCVCSLHLCFNWYPCALKYCKNKEGEGEHRCGIKTCRKCMTYRYLVKSKNYCSWDEV